MLRSSRSVEFDQEFRFLLERLTQVLIEVRKGGRIRLYSRDIAQEQPLTSEILHQRVRSRIGQHAPDLALQARRVAELAALGDREQLVVGYAAPQEEGQPRCELDLAHPVRSPGRHVRRIELDAENEFRRNENLQQRQSHAGLEAVFRSTLSEQRKQRRQIVRSNRSAVGAAREARDDLLRAGRFVGGRRRMAEENPVAARRVARPLHIVGTGDRNVAHAFEEVRLAGFWNTFDLDRVFEEGRNKRSRARFHRDADFEMRIRIAPRSVDHLARALIGGDGEQLEPLAIEPQVQLAFPLEPQELIEPAPLQADRDLILAIDREAVANGCPASRAERHRFAHAFELNESSRNVVGLIGDRKLRIARCERADLGCRREIAFQQQR